ncbi:hypothetical protein Pcinc_028938, partial [Petrolisthes cinctipes]
MNGLRILTSTFLCVYVTAQITTTTTTTDNFRHEGLVRGARVLLQDLLSTQDHHDCSLIFILDDMAFDSTSYQ